MLNDSKLQQLPAGFNQYVCHNNNYFFCTNILEDQAYLLIQHWQEAKSVKSLPPCSLVPILHT